ncbi:hypothetical protein EJ110_NYTH50220 [Nymphaea thermarum]|nr:hypothetical protein EJ110_NYTH50220 [Nymphaea thermarum]
MRHEVLVEWEGPDRGTSWEEFGSIVHRFPSSSARGQAQGREGESVTDQPLGPDPVGTEQAEPSRRKRKASDLWARSLQYCDVFVPFVFTPRKKKSSHSSSSQVKGNELIPYNNRREFKPNSKSGKSPPIRYLTPKQIEEYRRKGVCYRCEDKWDKYHQCKSLNSIVVVYDPENSSSSDCDSSSSSRQSSSSSSEEEVKVRRKPKKPEKIDSKKEEAPTPVDKQEETESLHTMQDSHKPNAMKVFGRINGHKVLILLDNGATNNFLTEEATKRCKVALQPRKPQTIIVGGGYRLKCIQEGKDMEVTINKRTFKVDSLVIPLEGVDLVLGSDENKEEPIPPCIQSVLDRFPEVFVEPSGLPPKRAYDHRIVLTQGAEPVNVRPYRYRHSQKAEIERLVKEMLQSGIIRPSCSPRHRLD